MVPLSSGSVGMGRTDRTGRFGLGWLIGLIDFRFSSSIIGEIYHTNVKISNQFRRRMLFSFFFSKKPLRIVDFPVSRLGKAVFS
jgi:hypothetical protein